jgi:hypothetical protein
VLVLEFLNEVIDETVIKILPTQVSITGSSLEDTILNGQQRHIECTFTKIEDENITFARNFLVKTVSDSLWWSVQ